jgi:hypothetical protein
MPSGQTPYVLRGGQDDLKRLFYSDPDKAFTRAITIPAGYGIVKAGAVMGIITESTSRVGQYVPYTGLDAAGNVAAGIDNLFGAAFLTDDPSTGTDGYVTMEDSYKFAVGDHLVAGDSDLSNTDLGAITAIDRTTYTHIAKITVTNAFDSETVAKGAVITIQSATASPYVAATGILIEAVDTGVGENAQGGQGVIVISNAMLYSASLYNWNADVVTDLGGSDSSPYYIF